MVQKSGKQDSPGRLSKQTQQKTLPLNIILICILGIVSIFAYSNTLTNGFVLDDHVAITDNYLVKRGFAGIPQLLTTHYLFGWSDVGSTYRPLSLVVFSVLYKFFGLDPLPFHALNVLVFAADVMLLFVFLDRLFDRRKKFVAFVASSLFALHPIHTEVVANIKSNDELLCFLFAFLSLNCLTAFVNQSKLPLLIAGFVFFLLSLLSKETAITFTVVIPFVFFFYKNEYRAKSTIVAVGIAFVSVAYLVIRYFVLTRYHPIDNNIDAIENALARHGLPYETRFATAFWILGYYLRLLFVPYPLVCDYSFNSISYVHVTNIWFILSFAAYLFLLILSVIRLWKHPRDPYAFGIVFFLTTISLFSNLVLLIGAAMAERFLFFGSVGFCLVVSLLLERLLKIDGKEIPEIVRGKGIGLAILLLPICAIYAVLTIRRNANWTDNSTLYTLDQAVLPNNARLSYYVADDIMAPAFSGKDDSDSRNNPSGRARVALPFLYQALSIYPRYALAENDLGLAYLHLNQLDSSELHYKYAHTYYPNSVSIVKGLAYVCYLNKDYFQSALYNKRLLKLSQPDPSIYLDIGYCYLGAGQYDSVLKFLRNGRLVFPKENVFNKNIAFVFMKIGNRDSALKYEAISRIEEPDFKLGLDAN